MKYTFKVTGMSCSHCERAVREAVQPLSGVREVTASAPKSLVIVQGEHVDTNAVAAAITGAGYEVGSSEESSDEDGHRARRTAAHLLLFALIAAGIAVTLRLGGGLGSVPVIPAEAGYGILFLAGILTSFHCVAMCGAIAIGVCAGKGGESGVKRAFLPSAFYNGGRIISYTAIGAIIGAAGSVFDFAPAVKSGIMIAAGIFMALMGLRMLGVLSFIRLPSFTVPFAKKFSAVSKYGPLAAGIANGLMPCGPLQMMQLFAFGTGSAAAGAASMFFFSLGTVPLMFGLGTASTFIHRRFRMTLYKAGGVLVAVLGIMTVMGGLALSGRTFMQKNGGAAIASVSGSAQEVTSGVSANAYQPIIVQKGVPVKWIMEVPASQLNGCNNGIVIPELGIEKKLAAGKNEISFTPEKSGTISFTCWMGMISSSILVVDNITSAASAPQPAAASSVTGSCGRSVSGGCCGRKNLQQ
jgi:sulfite exporter TauE/SafE/copper chaperone CopZ